MEWMIAGDIKLYPCTIQLSEFIQILEFTLVVCSSLLTSLYQIYLARHFDLDNKNKPLERIVHLIKNDSYVKSEMPQWINGSFVAVSVSVYIESMGNFKISEGTFQLDIYLGMNWYDTRLSHTDPNGVQITDLDLIGKTYRPDLYFVNARNAEFQDVLEPNRYIHIRPSGLVSYNTRVLLTLACTYRLRSFPFDLQTCEARMMSYSNDVNYMVLKWRETDPVKINPEIELSELKIVRLKDTYSEISFTRIFDDGLVNASFSCLTLSVETKRRPVHYILMAILPNGVIVVISWVSFWIDPHATPARVTLCFTAFLSLTTTAMTTSQMLPPVSYLTAMSLWTAVSGIFVFGTLFEFAVVYNYVLKAKLLKDELDARKINKLGLGITKLPMAMRINFLTERSDRLDRISRILFPSLYVVFVTGFATYYVCQSKELA